MPQYKLIYFAVTGRAEIARYMFKMAGVDFEDFRVSWINWPEFKKTIPPPAQLPILEVDGTTLPQSAAIYRYLARKLGFNGSSSWETARIDLAFETTRDCDKLIEDIFLAKGDEKTRLQKEILETKVPVAMRVLETQMKENNSSNGFFVGEKVSWADFAVFYFFNDILPFISEFRPEKDLPNYPLLSAHWRKIQSIPNIADWIKNRPEDSRFE